MKLIISEKNASAKRLASILSSNSVKTENKDGVPIYRYGKGDDESVVIGLKGHILRVDFPEEYEKWQDVEPRKLIDAPLIKIPHEKKIVKALKSLGKTADVIIVATDFDREGELIGKEALEQIKVKKDVIIHRARFSALTPQEIQRAFSNLEEIYHSLAAAGEARQDIDLVWGATLTRFLSLASTRLGKQFLSVGRVQSPTLALIVEKEEERKKFVPEPYWTLTANLKADDKEFIAIHRTDRFMDEKEARAALKGAEGKAEVQEIKKTTRRSAPPPPFHTTAFLSAAASIGLSPQAAMSTAEDLYTRGIISYPRVDNTVYPPSLDIKGLAEMLKQSTPLADAAKMVLAQDKLVPTRGNKEATDHPPIHPTEAMNPDDLGPREWKVYELVSRRFLATLAPEAVTETVKVDIAIGDQPFVAKGSTVTSEGWYLCYPYGRRKEEELPILEKGRVLEVLKLNFDNKETQPPGRYGQGRLIELMEKLGLGTKSTRHSIIQNLYERGYTHGDPVEPTELGIAVIKTLKKYAAHITTPKMTSQLEQDMDALVEERKVLNEVVDSSRAMLSAILAELEKSKTEVGTEIREGIRLGEIVGKCPVSGHDLKIVRSKATKKRFVGCSGYPDCKTTYPLPQSGGVIPTGENCPVCGNPKVKLIMKGRRPWEFCLNPQCEQGMGAGQGENTTTEMGTCPNCGKQLRLIRSPKTRKRFIGCSGYPNCKTIFPVPQRGTLEPSEKKCPVCNTPILKQDGEELPCMNMECPTRKKVPTDSSEEKKAASGG